MPYVRSGTKRRIFLTLAVINTLASTALLPAAFASSQWLVETLDARTYSSQTLATVDSSTTVTYGLLRTCTYTSYDYSCTASNWAIPASTSFVGCSKDSSDLKQRMNAVLTLLLFAFVLTVPNCAAALFQFFTSASIGNNSNNRRFYFLVQVVCSVLSIGCTFIAIAIYGDTYNSWLACGLSFCTAQLQRYNSVLPVVQASRFPNTSQDFVMDCGYGMGLGFAVASILSTLSYLILAVYNRTSPAAPPTSPPTLNQNRGFGHISAQPPKEPAGDTPVRLVPEGPDWEFDDDTQLYWSPSQELFFDPISGHFYDGATECWYDPNEKRWYKL
jgi:hypothetical protein